MNTSMELKDLLAEFIKTDEEFLKNSIYSKLLLILNALEVSGNKRFITTLELSKLIHRSPAYCYQLLESFVSQQFLVKQQLRTGKEAFKYIFAPKLSEKILVAFAKRIYGEKEDGKSRI